MYTDGSGIDRQIGAAATLYRNGIRKTTLRYRLGSKEHHTVYEGEAIGTILGAQLVKKEKKARKGIGFGIDNHATIRNLSSIKPAPGHHLIDRAIGGITAAIKRHRGIKTTIYWTAGHEDIEGNEAVDEEAKEAAKGNVSRDEDLPGFLRHGKPLPQSKSALRQAFRAKQDIQIATKFKKQPQYRKFRRIDSTGTTAAFQKLTKDMVRPQAALLVQLRTGHVALNQHLHRIGKIDSPTCPRCGQMPETVDHVLLRCTSYQTHRSRMEIILGRKGQSIQYLLTAKKAMKPLFEFLAATKRFTKAFGDVTPPT